MTEPLIAATVPRIRVEGEVIDALSVDLLELRIDETLDGLKTLELTLFADGPNPAGSADQPPEPHFLDGATLDFGKRIEVVLGSAEDPVVGFAGKISALEVQFEEGAPTRVCVLAEDALMDLRLTRRVQAWNDMRDAQIAAAIASRHGLAHEADVSGPTWESVQQWNMSDLAFLRDRARLIGAELWLEQNKLYFKARGDRRAPTITLARGGDLLHLVARADLAHQRSGIRVRGWDADRAEAIDAWAPGSLIRDEVGGATGLTGPELLERAFGKRSSVHVREIPHDEDQAHAFAEAELRRRARGLVKVSGVSSGSARMTVGARLTLDHVGAPFTGEGYYVTEVCHRFDREHGYRTSFDAERATIQGGSHG